MILVLVVCLLPLAVALSRANELFLLTLHGGKLRVVRGRIPNRLLSDLADVVASSAPEGTRLRGVVRDGHAAIDVRGRPLSAPLRQRLRNVISLWPVAKIRNAPPRR